MARGLLDFCPSAEDLRRICAYCDPITSVGSPDRPFEDVVIQNRHDMGVLNTSDAAITDSQTPLHTKRFHARSIPSSASPWRWLAPLGLLALFATLFVGLEIAERHLFPRISIGAKHATLTLSAFLVTAVTGLTIFLVMRRHQRRLADTAQTITNLIRSYTADRSHSVRFENPNIAHNPARQSTDAACAVHDSPGQRCWQVVSLRGSDHESEEPAGNIEQCLECPVYRKARPDTLTELGESFNDLMFLLEEEANKVGTMRAHFLEKEKMVAIGQMASGIAHEVCNPLSSISSVVQMLKRARSTSPQTKELEMIETHIQRISNIVRQMVTLSRPNEAKWERAEMGKILDDTLHLIQFDERARNVTIQSHVEEGLPALRVINGNLGQVFLNLSLNALDAMPGGGKLIFRAWQADNKIIVTVSDTGEGIDPGIGRRVFEPFFTTKEPGRGTGLGLAVTYSIIRKHDGDIEFNDNPDGGTVFTVTLPILKEKAEVRDGQENSVAG